MTVEQILANAMVNGAIALRAELIRQAEISDDDARRTSNIRARQGAEARRNACLAAYDDAGCGAINGICADTGKLVVAVGAACKVLGVSSAKRNAALAAFEERGQ